MKKTVLAIFAAMWCLCATFAMEVCEVPRAKKRRSDGSLLQINRAAKKSKKDEQSQKFDGAWYWLPLEMKAEILRLTIQDSTPEKMLKSLKRLELTSSEFKKIGSTYLLKPLIKKLTKKLTFGCRLQETIFEKICVAGDSESFDAFLEAGVACSDQTALVALLNAAHKKHTSLVEKLLKSGALRTDGSFVSHQLLSAIIEGKPLATIKRLIKKGANVNAKDMSGMTPFLFAVNTSDIETVEFLIKRDADIQAKNGYGENGLFIAVKNNDIRMAEFLIGAGLSVLQRNGHDETPILIAARLDMMEIAKMLLQHNAKINVKKRAGNRTTTTPLICAVKNGDKEMVSLFLDHKADVNAKDGNGLSPLWHALDSNGREIAEILIARQAGSKTCARDSDLFIKAARCGHVYVVKFLLSQGADIDAQDLFGSTALHYAALNNYQDIVELLINLGADTSRVNSNGKNALMLAQENNHADVVNNLQGRLAG